MNITNKGADNMLADYHIHSRYSDDSEEDMEIIVNSAIEKSFDEICFTDHVESEFTARWVFFLDVS